MRAQEASTHSQHTYSAGLLWLAVFFWWGAKWIRTAGRYTARYTFWVTIALLAAVHFSLQLTAQIVYIRNGSQPKWLAILGFPNKRSLQKLQVRDVGIHVRTVDSIYKSTTRQFGCQSEIRWPFFCLHMGVLHVDFLCKVCILGLFARCRLAFDTASTMISAPCTAEHLPAAGNPARSAVLLRQLCAGRGPHGHARRAHTPQHL